MKVSEFLNNEISPFLLGAFFGRYKLSTDKNFIYSTSTYNISKYLKDREFFNRSKDDYLEKLNIFSQIDIWTRNKPKSIKNSEFSAILENDLSLSIESFYNSLHVKILNSNFIVDDELTEDKKMFIRGFMELRGSLDIKYSYISQDYFYNNQFELKRARLLIDYFNFPVEELNLNFRELQNQFIDGIERNTQFRIKLNWYLSNIGLFNIYKANMINNHCFEFQQLEPISNIIYFNTPQRNISNNLLFEERLIKYANKIFGKDLDTLQIAQLREELEFDKISGEKYARNKNIVELVRLFTEDECACCKDLYNIKDRTFLHRRTNRLYFEIHHVISLNNRIELDDENNLVKLCPACHSAVKKGVADENTQKYYIANILEHSQQSLEFAKHIFNTNDKDLLIEKIYEHLK